ncbi:M15 family metallopeptidase [Streptomyces sp. XM4193]|uniref:M15 family metallopeptidase n=1 Tax=Streptomyces sp. XM4193 TaxID=2929782 RepID=UPI001FFB366B|nr:M15 family metallopeptidase [Streptomyces sp. XM4193]MCK1797674.1 M15 family metallopeptidase [Streptomyces sp. XM4193]
MRHSAVCLLVLAASTAAAAAPDGSPAPVGAPEPVGASDRSSVPEPVGTPDRPDSVDASARPSSGTARSPGSVPDGERRAPAEFTALESVAPSILQEIRYAGSHNFVGEPIPGYREAQCLLTRDTALALRRAQRAALAAGHSLKVYDCYRPQRSVDRFVRWAKDPSDIRMKQEFYPRVDKERLIPDGYIAERSGHSRGSTVDLTLVPGYGARPGRPGGPGPCGTGSADRGGDGSLDMGTGYDCFDVLSHTDHPEIVGKQRANRQWLRRLLEREGFVNLPEEWWHFTHRPETFPDRWFDFPVAREELAGRR